jgi:hypothetical protein
MINPGSMMAAKPPASFVKINNATRIQTHSTQWLRVRCRKLLVRVTDAFVLLDVLHKFGAVGRRYLENFLVGGLVGYFPAVELWKGPANILGSLRAHAFRKMGL